MRVPDRERPLTKLKVSSPLVVGSSVDSNDSDPIDISRSSAESFSSVEHGYISPTYGRQHSYRSFSGSHPSSYSRRLSTSRSVGSFVGSYEESILSGRMSQTPSKPLDFTASIGVLGKGKCKSSLRCPPHLNVPFPAYFYSETSPYVGQIDLELGTEEKHMHKRGYRIPAEGQLQIIIKNPNKTAVKLFLLPYNLTHMPPSSKTFLRQKHYDVRDGDKLKYAIHVQICCPSEGKFYMHKSQRVVFANRVPDGKENLRVVLQGPTPTYTPWVPEKRQKRSERHSRPDGREPNFIGGSLLDRDHDITEQRDEEEQRYQDGQATPRPAIQRSPVFLPRRTSFMRSASSLSLEPPAMREAGAPNSQFPVLGGGILAERLKALAIARETGRQ